MIAASLLSRVPSVLLEGSPVSPPDRVANTIERYNVSVLKAGSTFLRMLMTLPDGIKNLKPDKIRSLRLGTFCAEPVNEAVHRFAAEHLTSNYINSYWATEHGAIVWSRCYGNIDQPLQPDTRCWPLPWVTGDVDVLVDEAVYTAAADGVQGEVVIRQRYPYQALTVWQTAGFGAADWRGDVQRWSKYFVPQVGYVQGDAAIRHADGAFTFHGRTDEVINVGGNRIGTEEIENAFLVYARRDGSPLRNAVVVGMPDAVLGTVPCAFITLQQNATLSHSDERHLRTLVRSKLGPVGELGKIIVATSLPETYSGKFMRKLLRAILTDAPLGDLGALRNPECVPTLQHAVRAALHDPEPLEQPDDYSGSHSLSLFSKGDYSGSDSLSLLSKSSGQPASTATASSNSKPAHVHAAAHLSFFAMYITLLHHYPHLWLRSEPAHSPVVLISHFEVMAMAAFMVLSGVSDQRAPSINARLSQAGVALAVAALFFYILNPIAEHLMKDILGGGTAGGKRAPPNVKKALTISGLLSAHLWFLVELAAFKLLDAILMALRIPRWLAGLGALASHFYCAFDDACPWPMGRAYGERWSTASLPTQPAFVMTATQKRLHGLRFTPLLPFYATLPVLLPADFPASLPTLPVRNLHGQQVARCVWAVLAIGGGVMLAVPGATDHFPRSWYLSAFHGNGERGVASVSAVWRSFLAFQSSQPDATKVTKAAFLIADGAHLIFTAALVVAVAAWMPRQPSFLSRAGTNTLTCYMFHYMLFPVVNNGLIQTILSHAPTPAVRSVVLLLYVGWIQVQLSRPLQVEVPALAVRSCMAFCRHATATGRAFCSFCGCKRATSTAAAPCARWSKRVNIGAVFGGAVAAGVGLAMLASVPPSMVSQSVGTASATALPKGAPTLLVSLDKSRAEAMVQRDAQPTLASTAKPVKPIMPSKSAKSVAQGVLAAESAKEANSPPRKPRGSPGSPGSQKRKPREKSKPRVSQESAELAKEAKSSAKEAKKSRSLSIELLAPYNYTAPRQAAAKKSHITIAHCRATRCETLQLKDTSLRTLAANTFKGMEHVRSLILQTPSLQALGPHSLRGLNLTALLAMHLNIQSVAPNSGVEDMKCLRYLDVCFSPLGIPSISSLLLKQDLDAKGRPLPLSAQPRCAHPELQYASFGAMNGTLVELPAQVERCLLASVHVAGLDYGHRFSQPHLWAGFPKQLHHAFNVLGKRIVYYQLKLCDCATCDPTHLLSAYGAPIRVSSHVSGSLELTGPYLPGTSLTEVDFTAAQTKANTPFRAYGRVSLNTVARMELIMKLTNSGADRPQEGVSSGRALHACPCMCTDTKQAFKPTTHSWAVRAAQIEWPSPLPLPMPNTHQRSSRGRKANVKNRFESPMLVMAESNASYRLAPLDIVPGLSAKSEQPAETLCGPIDALRPVNSTTARRRRGRWLLPQHACMPQVLSHQPSPMELPLMCDWELARWETNLRNDGSDTQSCTFREVIRSAWNSHAAADVWRTEVEAGRTKGLTREANAWPYVDPLLVKSLNSTAVIFVGDSTLRGNVYSVLQDYLGADPDAYVAPLRAAKHNTFSTSFALSTHGTSSVCLEGESKKASCVGALQGSSAAVHVAFQYHPPMPDSIRRRPPLPSESCRQNEETRSSPPPPRKRARSTKPGGQKAASGGDRTTSTEEAIEYAHAQATPFLDAVRQRDSSVRPRVIFVLGGISLSHEAKGVDVGSVRRWWRASSERRRAVRGRDEFSQEGHKSVSCGARADTDYVFLFKANGPSRNSESNVAKLNSEWSSLGLPTAAATHGEALQLTRQINNMIEAQVTILRPRSGPSPSPSPSPPTNPRPHLASLPEPLPLAMSRWLALLKRSSTLPVYSG